jgi:ubiquinone/menaquinone biosynthesis C-methylase UbiE
MRDPWGLNEKVFAQIYPFIMGVSEKAGQAQTRAELLRDATLRTLEIGTGNGYNLPHYGPGVTELVLTEPSPSMVAQLNKTISRRPPTVDSVEVVQTGAEQLPFKDATFDTVVGTYVHCTIPNPEAALREIARVLRPGGRYLFMEHVRGAEGTRTARFQDLIEPVHTYVAAGCHPNRDIARMIKESPLRVERLEIGRVPHAVPSVRPRILGVARRQVSC